MPGSVYHAYTQTVPDSPATSVVRPSDWNSAHVISGIPDGISLLGNTAGVLAAISNGTLYLAGGNNVTLSQNANSVTVSGPNQQTGISSIADGANTQTAGMLSFSNANGVTFGLSTGVGTGTLTASIAAQSAQTQSNIQAVYDGANSILTGTVRFTNANGVTFSVNGQTLSASVKTDYQTSGAYLTTADLSQNSSNYIRNWKLTGNTSGTTSSAQGTDLWLAGGNGVTLSGSSNSVSVSVATNYQSQGAYLTTAMQSNAATLSNVNLSAGATSQNLSAFVFSNSNGMSFGLSGSTVTASFSAPPAQTVQTLGLYGVGNTTQNSSTTLDARTLSFDGLGGVTVGFSNGSVQISGPQTAAQTAQTVGLYGLGNTTQNSSTTLDARTLSFNGLGGMTVGYSNGSIQLSAPQTAAQTAQTVGLYAVGNTTQNSTTTLDARTLSFDFLGAVTGGYSNGSIQVSAPVQTNQTVGLYGLGNTTQNSSTTLDARSLSFNGLGIVTVGYSNGSIQISATDAAQTNQTVGLYALGNTTQNSSTTLDARTLSFNGLGIVTVGYSNGSIQVSATTVAQTNQTLGLYAVGNTTQNSSTTLDARTLSFNAVGAMSMGYSNGSIQASVPATSSLSATGWASISTNGSTISIGATYTANLYASSNTVGTSSGTADPRSLSIAGQGFVSVAASNSGWNVSGTFTQNVYAAGNTFTSSSGTCDPRSITLSGQNGIQVQANNSGWAVGEIPVSVSEPFPILTGTAYSSHAPASWWFNRLLLDNPLAVSNINVVKSLNAAVPLDTAASSGRCAISYSHGITVFSRQNYGAQSSNLTTVTTASIGFTASISYTSISQSVAYSFVTNTTGGTTSFSTTSSNGNWSSYFTGPFVMQIPCLTTLQQGEYFFAHAHSTTTGTTGNSNFTLMSFSNLHIAPQVVGPLGVLQSSGTQASMNPWGMGAGVASAVTTNNSMAGSVVSGATQNNWYMALSNV